jgi:hypothetical protein
MSSERSARKDAAILASPVQCPGSWRSGWGPRSRFLSQGEWGGECVPAGKIGLTYGLSPSTLFRTFRTVSHPHSASRRRDTAPIQGGGVLPKRRRSCGLCLADRRHDCGGVRVGVSLEAAVGDRPGVR